MKTTVLKWMRLLIFSLGIVGLFIADRYFYVSDRHVLLRVVAMLFVLAGALIPFFLAADAAKNNLPGERKSWLLLASWQLTVFAGLCVYLLYVKTMGDLLAPDSFLQKALLALWLGLLILGFFAGIGLEFGHRSSGTGPYAEPKRLTMVAGGWLLIGIFGCALVCLNFASNKMDRVYDWSYFKTTVASESSKSMVAGLEKDLSIAMFFPRDNEVKYFVSEYFASLAASSPRVKVFDYDKDLSPTMAEQYKVSHNGLVALSYGENGKKTIEIGLDLKAARPVLSKLDTKFQEVLASLSSKEQMVYFTRGHGEMSVGSSDNPMRAIRGVELILKTQNFKTKDLNARDGSLSKVPDDAAMVVIAGATQPFLSEEFKVLQDYVVGGGRLFVWLDQPDGESALVKTSGQDPEIEFLKSIGLNISDAFLANDKASIAATRTKVDRLFWYTNNFGSHESVSLLARNDDQFGVIAYRSRYLEIIPGNKSWRTFETIKSLDSSFADTNRNMEFDVATEKRKAYPIVVAVEQINAPAPAPTPSPGSPAPVVKKGRVVVVAGAAMFSDFLIRNPGNQLMFIDDMRWLSDSMAKVTGTAASEEDIQVRFSKNRDLYVFYGTVFLLPVLVLLVGFFATRKRQVKKVVEGHA